MIETPKLWITSEYVHIGKMPHSVSNVSSLSLCVFPSSVLPAFVEIILFIAVLGLKKKPL